MELRVRSTATSESATPRRRPARWVLDHRRGGAGLALLAALIVAIALTRPADPNPFIATVALDPNSSPVFMDAQRGVAFISSYGVDTHAEIDVNARLRVLDTSTGRILRTIPLPQPIGTDMPEIEPSIPGAGEVEAAGKVYLLGQGNGETTEAIMMLDARSGRLLRTVPFPGDGTDWITVDARTQRLFVLEISFPTVYVSVYDARTLRHITDTTIDSPAATNAGPSLVSSPIVVDARTNRVFASFAASNNLGVLDARNGNYLSVTALRPLTNTAGNSTIINTPVLDERLGRVYVTDTASGAVNTVDAASGRLLRSVTVGANASVPIVDERTRRLFVIHVGGVSILDALSGRLLATHSLTLPDFFTDAAVDEQSGHVYVNSGGAGTVSVLDGSSGTMLRTITISHAIGTVLVDARHRRLLIFDSGGQVINGPDSWSWVPRWLRRWVPFLPPPGPHIRTVAGSVTIMDTAHL